ncbi:hypothetical protein MNBD_NITROSPINAE01-61 [hydrothermal vent metagenome]|uniref:DUF1858 domain-containing protein n=1 Tax=hydrothermal vent metagenome TaxID=652676 RepID=A0A3B1C8H6_9ZZZZ
MGKITNDMILHSVMKEFSGSVAVFDSYNMGCKSCSGGRIETVEWGAMVHGIAPDELLKKLNAQTGVK